jgi:hypothetical protein
LKKVYIDKICRWNEIYGDDDDEKKKKKK